MKTRHLTLYIFPHLLFENLLCVVPYPEEVLVPSEQRGLRVGLDVGAHARLAHPRPSVRRAERQRRRLVQLRLHVLLILRVV